MAKINVLGRETAPVRPEGDVAYYNYPAIKKPSWRWQVPAYFYLGGLAAGSYLVATVADLLGTEEDRRSVGRAGRYLALGAVTLCPVLLISDLGRPERFLNMLRIVKTRSPMNMGTWALASFSAFAGMGALRQAATDGIIPRHSALARPLTLLPMRVFSVFGSLAGFFLGSYTGVLLSFTNVPLWAKNRLLEAPLFLTSAIGSGLAAISLVLNLGGGPSRGTRRWLGQAETAVMIGETGLIAGTIATLGIQSRPLFRPRYALPFWLGAIGLGLVAPIVLKGSEKRSTGGLQRALRVGAALSVLTGELALRFVLVNAGQKQAEDPLPYLTYTRKGQHTNGRSEAGQRSP